MTAHIYRCYDADDVLLYVGCAFNPQRRIATHMRSRRTLASHALQTLMTRYEVEGPFPTREDAEDAERAAIQDEKPLLNRQHYGDANWLADLDLAAYLDARGYALEQVGLHRCASCGILRRHSSPRGMCGDCREAAAEGRLDDWLAAIA